MAATEDLFTPIHKALRSMLYHLSGRLQTNDFADVASTKALVNDLEHDFGVARSAGCVVCVMSHHATDEESAIFPAVGRVGNGLVASLIEEHHALSRREQALTAAGRALLEKGSASDRIDAGIRLNQMANELLAAYLAHMNREDVELVPFMRAHFTDEQMVEMRGTIMRGMPPDRLFAILGWMLPSLNVTELSGMLTSVGKGAPPQVMQAIIGLCSERVDPTRWAEVRVRTGL